jgi:crotonobetainyl-CoA:carnitine CoA-transferase CaiB-like acyl-CoA transferase
LSASPQALAGIGVVEFGSYAAGPHIGKMLANFGATVIHVESFARPDGFRMQYPPYKDRKPGINSGGCFAYFNDSKLGITLDLKNPQGQALARRLCRWGDIVIENMRPGVIDRLGLGFDTLKADHPGLIMLSTCNMGQTGPRADTPGFGSQLTALAGICGLTGERGGLPTLLYGPYIDFIASTLGAVAVLAALEQRRRTGTGAHIDISQYEAGLLFLAGPLLDYHLTGRIAERAGNDDPDAAPHGAYRCESDGWIALSCWSDEEFKALAAAIGRPEWSRDARFKTLAGRKGAAPAIDAGIGAWTRERGAASAAALLQGAGVHAHPVNSMADLFSDPQLVARRHWSRQRHPVIGEHAYCGPAFELSETPGEVTSAAPLLGADNDKVFREILGLPDSEYAAMREAGAFA